MSFFLPEQPNKHPSKPCRILLSAVKDVFAPCRSPRQSLPVLDEDEEYAASEIDEQQEVVILTIRTLATEAKLKRKGCSTTESFRWLLSPTKGGLFVAPMGLPKVGDDGIEQDDDEESDAFFSVGSRLTRFSYSSSGSREAFVSTGSCLSHCSAANGMEHWNARRRSILQELSHCEGWPFGLCRRAMMLPPLPTSPSESWSWRKASLKVKTRNL